MIRNLMALILLELVLSLAATSPGVTAPPQAAAKTTPAGQAKGASNGECLGCHADKGLTKQVEGKSVSLFTDEPVLKASVHGRLECTACHIGITEVPHPEKLAPLACQKCHARTASTFGQSIHGRKEGPGLDCKSCHGTHEIAPAKKLGAALSQGCHEQTVKVYLGSVHGRALANGVKEAALCFDCHGEAHQVRAQADPDSPTNRNRMAETCGRCHADRALVERRQIPIPRAYQLYQKSVHAGRSRRGRRRPPAATGMRAMTSAGPMTRNLPSTGRTSPRPAPSATSRRAGPTARASTEPPWPRG